MRSLVLSHLAFLAKNVKFKNYKINRLKKLKTVKYSRCDRTTACAIAFLRKIDKLNESQMAWVQNIFGIQSEEFWELVGILHKNELVDMYEDEVVRISDQVLSTYFFYLSVFEKKIIPFSLIVSDFYPDFKRTIVDALNPVINAFDQMKIVKEIRGEIKDIFDAISRAEKQSDSIKFLNSFWFALPTETLIFANKAISEIQQVDIVWENEIFEEAKDGPDESSLVSLLSNFRNYKNKEFKLSFDLLLNYLEKDKQSLGHIIRELKDKYNFKPKDQRYGYLIQIHIVNTLIERMNNGGNYLFTRLFMLVAEYYLKVEHTEYQWARGGDSLSMITFKLSPDDYLRPLRKKLFEHLSGLLNIVKYKDNAQAVFQEYFSHFKYEVKEIALADLPYIKDYFVNNLNHTDISPEAVNIVAMIYFNYAALFWLSLASSAGLFI